MPLDSGDIPISEHDLDRGFKFPKNHYEVLGVSSTASEEEIQKAYRKVLIEGLHEDKILAMPDGVEKDIAKGNLEAAKEALNVLGNPRLRASYDQAHGIEGRAHAESAENKAKQEKVEQELNLALTRLQLVKDKAQMIAVIQEHNSLYPGEVQLDQRVTMNREMIVSVPEGDYQIMSSQLPGSEIKTLVALELPLMKKGDVVNAIRSDGRIDSGWQIEDFGIRDVDGTTVRTVIVTKPEGKEIMQRTMTAKGLRAIN